MAIAAKRQEASVSTLARPQIAFADATLELTKRTVGIVVLALSGTLVFIPIPLSNVVPALTIALISLAYLEGDGVLLSIALLAALVLLSVAAVAGWEMAIGTKWIIDRR
jgi:hypothetical protein